MKAFRPHLEVLPEEQPSGGWALKALVNDADGAIRRRLEAAVIEVDTLPTKARRGTDLSGGVDH